MGAKMGVAKVEIAVAREVARGRNEWAELRNGSEVGRPPIF
jgi:hypothetical protein